jgi:hypothetical protein
MRRVGKTCQSCGMPLKRDEKGGGSNADGSRSALYCSHCYVDGAFVDPQIDVKQMQAKVKEKLMGFGIPGIFCWIFTNQIPKLERWKS